MVASAPLGRLSGPYFGTPLRTPLRLRKTFTALMAVFLLAGAGTHTAATAQGFPDTMLPLQIDEVIFDSDTQQLVALGSLGDTTFESPVNLSLADPDLTRIESEDLLAALLAAGDGCEILDLELGAIELNLLGLRVETSDICLIINADAGENNLLGNLLCAVAGLLDGGATLDQILNGGLLEDAVDLDGSAVDALLGQLRDLLNEALAEITSPASVVGVSGTNDVIGGLSHGPGQGSGHGGGQGGGQAPNADCDILNLSLGPIDLDLLGLVVILDNCEGGPVTVDITAVPGEGNLLGNLLCNLAGLLDSPATDLTALMNAFNPVAQAIRRLTGA